MRVLNLMQSSPQKSWQEQVFDLLFNEQNPEGMHGSVTRWSTLLILLNVLAMVLETADAFKAAYAVELAAFETLSVIVFTMEYLLRWWTAPERTTSPSCGPYRTGS